MQGYDASTYGDRMDDHQAIGWPVAQDTQEAVDFLYDTVKPATALELGVGTGRVAVPLVEKGVRVIGIDASQAMLDLMAQEPGGSQVQPVRGDFADGAPGGPFDLIYAVQYTFFLLSTQEEQIRCFRTAAEQLAPGGAFALQLFVPDPQQLIQTHSTDPLQVELEQVILRVSQYDALTQTVNRQYVAITESGARTKLYPMVFRYAWPAELDLMARLAGLELQGRWGGWHQEPFTGSGGYVAIYRKPE
jgi:SAM-dependent methyltransferase